MLIFLIFYEYSTSFQYHNILKEISDIEKFFIKYNEEILKSKPENVRKAAGINLSEVVILFDKNMNMLFYGTAKRAWKKNSDILKEYSRAFFKRRILTDTSGTVVIKLPIENLIEK